MASTDALRKLAIVPAYNEGEMIQRVVREIRREAPDFDVVVVDDGSIQVDGDGQHKPSYIPALLEALGTGSVADMVYGSRFRGDPGYKVPFGRRVGNLIFSIVLTGITR